MTGIYVSTSNDGTSFGESTKILDNGAAGSWEASNIYCPMVWKEAYTYNSHNYAYIMIYGGYAADGYTKVGLAYADAPEGPWVKDADNPVYVNTNVLTGPGAEPWGMIKVDSIYYLWVNNYGSLVQGERQQA
jgi:hypothetical protein